MNEMKRLNIIFLIFIASVPTLLFGQKSLTIEIEGLKSSKGQILLEFNNEKGEKINGISQPVENRKCIIVINDLKPGNYVFKYFHDENSNKALDVNGIGIPKEGFGFSNNAKGFFGPPSLKKMRIEIKENKMLKCTPTYL
jgi:uncharacterized protein (DUF2141 family)